MVVLITMMMREVHKCGQVCLFIKVGQVASNWETPSGFKLGDPKGFIQSDLLDQNLERNKKKHCFAFSISFFATKEQNSTPRNKVNQIHFASLQWPDEEVESDGIDSEVLGKQFASAVQGEPPARLEGLR